MKHQHLNVIQQLYGCFYICYVYQMFVFIEVTIVIAR